MLKSMTAYGRASLKTEAGQFVFEIQSVNRKFLEVVVIVPKELGQFDIEIKKWILPHVNRGNITVKVNASFGGTGPFVVRANLPLVRQLREASKEIAKEAGFDENAFSLSLLSAAEGLVKYEQNPEDEEIYREILREAFEKALKNFLQVKFEEGAVLQTDILLRIEHIGRSMTSIEGKSTDATFKYRDKLVARLNELLSGQIENEERVLREVAIFAEKIDIAEEITRFGFHINHLKELVQSPVTGVGKTLEFVLQELNREINTIGSKSPNVEITRCVIDIKSELEKIREQVQNVE